MSTINLSKLDFKCCQHISINTIFVPINLSKLDFKLLQKNLNDELRKDYKSIQTGF